MQIISTSNASYNNYMLSSNVVIKDYTQPIEPEVVAATLCLAGFLRGPMFKAQALHEKNAEVHFGYPIAHFVPNAFRETSDSVFLLSKIFSKQEAERKIEELVGKIGGEA